MKIDFKYIEDARQELQEKSMEDIQIETAKKWAARAYVAYEIAAYFESEDRDNVMGWFYIGEEYRRKALEHAALVEAEDESTSLLNSIRELLNPFRELLNPFREVAIESDHVMKSEVEEEETVFEDDIEEASSSEEIIDEKKEEKDE
jgi:hypothetical protein